MFRILKKKRTLALSVVAVLAVAAAAIAYWTTTGSGTGSGTAASANGTIVLHASFQNDALYPGGSVPVSYTAENSGDTDLRVGTVHVDSITTNKPGCNVADFSVADVAQDFTVVHHTTTPVSLPNQGSLVFANDPANSQDPCKGAEITLTLSSN